MIHPDDAAPDEILERLKERAAQDAAEDSSAAVPDLLNELTDGSEGPAPDMTFRGYVDTHDRVPAFEGSDGRPYTVDVDTEEGAHDWGAFLVFVRWASTGAGIIGHLTSHDVGRGASEEEAREAALDLTLFELKTELDRTIRDRAELLED